MTGFKNSCGEKQRELGKESVVFSSKIKHEQGLELSEGKNHVDVCRKNLPGKVCCVCKGLDDNISSLLEAAVG